VHRILSFKVHFWKTTKEGKEKTNIKRVFKDEWAPQFLWVEHVVDLARNTWCTTRLFPWLKVRKNFSTLNWMVYKNMQERGKF